MGLNAMGASLSSALGARRHSPDYRQEPWYTAYMAAFFESDRSRIGERIERAGELMLRRERELYMASSDLDERRALNRARHALQALQMCLKL